MAFEAGVGAQIHCSLGKAVPIFTGQLSDPPLQARFNVKAISDGRCVLKGPMMTGVAVQMGPSACLEIDGILIAVVSGKVQLLDRELLRTVGIHAEQMKIVIDRAVLLGIKDQAAAANRGLTAGAITGMLNLGVTGTPLSVVSSLTGAGAGDVEILTVMLRLGQALDEQNIPESGRWIIMPTWAATMVKRSELRQAYLSGDGVSMLRNGRLGMVDRFTLYTSNLIPFGTAAGLAAGEFLIYAGQSHALTFATQMTEMETLRSELTFGQIMRGLQVYGYKVLDGTALAQAVIVKSVTSGAQTV